MKKYIFAFSLILSSTVFAQIEVGAGMGLNFFSAPDLRDYINSNFATTDEMQSFNTSADFFCEVDYNLNDKYQLGIDYTFNIYSFNSNFITGIYDFQLSQHKPSILGYYLIGGEGYKLKLGGGVGVRFAQVDEKLPSTTEKVNYSSTGFGLLLKAQGDTRLSKNLYALISGEIRYDIHGTIETITPGVNFNLNSFGVALKLGVVYYF